MRQEIFEKEEEDNLARERIDRAGGRGGEELFFCIKNSCFNTILESNFQYILKKKNQKISCLKRQITMITHLNMNRRQLASVCKYV